MSGQYDAPSIGSPENFLSSAWDHRAIKSAVDAMAPADSEAAAGTWTDAATQWTAALGAFSQSIDTVIRASWDGESAEAAKKSIGNYATDALKLTDQLEGVRTAMSDAIAGAEAVRGAVGEPVESSGGWTKVLPWNWDNDEASDAAEQSAKAAMEALYKPAYRSADLQVPSIDPPLAVGDSSVAQPFRSLPDLHRVAADHSGSNPTVVDDNASTPTAITEPRNPAVPEDVAGAEPARTSAAANEGQPIGREMGPNGMHGVPGSQQGAASGAGSGSLASGSAGTGMSGAAPGSDGGQDRRKRDGERDEEDANTKGHNGIGGIPGAAIAGALGGGAAQYASSVVSAHNAGAATASAPVAPAGPRGMSMTAPGTKAEDDEEKERDTPTYLVNIDNGSELVGDLPLVTPAVIGE